MSDSKAVIKSVDMSEEMQQEAIECSTQALEKYNIEKDIAAHIKREFDRKYGKFLLKMMDRRRRD
jgi:dynein light chain LC8-type